MARTLRRFVVGLLLTLVPAVAVAQSPTHLPKLAADPACSADYNGALYYNTATSKVRFCNGAAWADVAGGGSESDFVVERSMSVTSDGMTFVRNVPAAATTAASIIVCGVLGTTADGLTPETIAAAGLSVTVENRVAGVSFDVRVESAYGLEGTIRVHCIGR